ncbi:hypothetical protein [Synechococcus sp. PCC 6312]|uniref:hypothetical protein n=1 Tax=Synechococcus sp. (strain ATCC 27167 / PCC 6312) TaxID=195253 RepID=UPI00029F0C57|nr:hypothetical protein [Synechococcus sp. PCC 6312]AFY62141.1 hypothetical protein Syn6312_3091 [Synechococcus sp. PCC 6312]
MKKLAPVTVYYIRKLLRKEQGNLKCIVVDGACLAANPEADLNAVLESLYLDAEEIAEEVLHLETLVMSHQMIGENGPAGQLQKVEAEIFWILGLKRIALSSEQSGPGTRVGLGMAAFSY